jgi:hypothetical protein
MVAISQFVSDWLCFVLLTSQGNSTPRIVNEAEVVGRIYVCLKCNVFDDGDVQDLRSASFPCESRRVRTQDYHVSLFLKVDRARGLTASLW